MEIGEETATLLTAYDEALATAEEMASRIESLGELDEVREFIVALEHTLQARRRLSELADGLVI